MAKAWPDAAFERSPAGQFSDSIEN